MFKFFFRSFQYWSFRYPRSVARLLRNLFTPRMMATSISFVFHTPQNIETLVLYDLQNILYCFPKGFSRKISDSSSCKEFSDSDSVMSPSPAAAGSSVVHVGDKRRTAVDDVRIVAHARGLFYMFLAPDATGTGGTGQARKRL